MSRTLTSGSQPAFFLALTLLCLLPGEEKGSRGWMHCSIELVIARLLVFCPPWRMCRELDRHALQDTHCLMV